MKNVLLLCLIVGSLQAVGQTRPLAKDVSSVDGMINAFYEIVSGPAGQKRDWARDKTLYVPGITFTTLNTVDGKLVTNTLTHDEFIAGSAELEETGFFEKEINRVTDRFGHMVHVWSTYEYRMTPLGTVMGRGINSIQLFYDGDRWWIKSAVWQTEGDMTRIPNKYLPK